MILHLVHDEKIINRTIGIFESVAPNKNIFVVFTRHQLKHVKPQKNVIFFEDFNKSYDVEKFSSVIIHFLNSRKIKFVKKYIPKKLPVFWIIWGNDLYNKLLYPKGFELYDKQSSYCQNNKKIFIKNLFNKFIGVFKTIKIEKFISEYINYIAIDITETDYKMLLKYYPKFKSIQCKEFFYYPIEAILGENFMQKRIEGNNIQIGNSASITNNHEYAMRFLSKLKIENRNVFVPLSYSGTKEYKNSVKLKGVEYFGDKFKALDDFLPLKEYNKLMLSFGFAIYGNFRQEAIGNILVSLYLGTKVFLPKDTPVYLWAKKHNLIVFELETISQEEINEFLDENSRTNNRNIILKIYNLERLKSLITEIFIVNPTGVN